MEGNTCIVGWVIKGKWADLTAKLYAAFEFLVHYLVHMIALIFLYGKVIYVSKKALNSTETTTSTATQKVMAICISLLC